MVETPRSTTETQRLLEQFHEGDTTAMHRLLERHHDWIRRQIHRRLEPYQRREGDTLDYVNDIVVRILRQGPRFVVKDAEHLSR